MDNSALIFKKIELLKIPFFNFIDKLSFNYKGAFDILIISLLIFFLFALFRKTKSTAIILGVILLSAIYGLSLILNLPLTQTIFRSFFQIFLIILAIVFQKELRRFFELVGVIGLKRKMPLLAAESNFKAIIKAADYFAKHKMGALIVFPGKEPLDRHLEGGVSLNGKISFPLLLSIFDESSPGHDGAVIIENDLIKKFAVHLPLAENIEAVRKFGTRHRAALGLAELTDAFCIIVSEEKGTVSIARNKKIITLENIEDLEKKLKEFSEKISPEKKVGAFKIWLKNNAKTIIASFVFASSLWLIFSYQTSVIQKKFIVPVEFKNIKQGYFIEKYSPEEFSIFFSGRENDFKIIDPDSIKISMNLDQIKTGWQRLEIKKENIKYPSTISLIKIEPETIRVNTIKLPELNSQ